MIKVCCYIHPNYIFDHVVGLLKQRSLWVHSLDEKALTVTGMICRSCIANLWKVSGLHLMREIK